MKLSSVCALAAFAACLSLPLPADAGSISGELVVTNPSERQFRIVDQSGYFRAPSGIPLEGLDGKPVIVELSDNRQVLSITEKHIHIAPVESVYETITGELVVVDAAAGIFSIAGAPRTYVAPRSVDPQRYAGRQVELFLGERGEVLQLDLAGGRGDPAAIGGCAHGGKSHRSGATLCQAGAQYRCENNSWRNLGVACEIRDDRSCSLDGTLYSDGAARCENGVRFVCEDGRWGYRDGGCGAHVTTARLPATCMLDGATLADTSSICRDGVTFRCANGTWINVGTACR